MSFPGSPAALQAFLQDSRGWRIWGPYRWKTNGKIRKQLAVLVPLLLNHTAGLVPEVDQPAASRFGLARLKPNGPVNEIDLSPLQREDLRLRSDA
jgi:hypothetical protein